MALEISLILLNRIEKKNIKIIKETPATTLIDANQVSGPFSTKKAMEITIKKAKTQGTASCARASIHRLLKPY